MSVKGAAYYKYPSNYPHHGPRFNFPTMPTTTTTSTPTPTTTIEQVVSTVQEIIKEMASNSTMDLNLGINESLNTTASEATTKSFGLDEMLLSNNTVDLVEATDSSVLTELMQNNTTDIIANSTMDSRSVTEAIATTSENIATFIVETTTEIVASFTQAEDKVDWLGGNSTFGNDTILNMNQHNKMASEDNYLPIYLIMGGILGILIVICTVLLLAYILYKKRNFNNIQSGYTLSSVYIPTIANECSTSTKNGDTVKHTKTKIMNDSC